MKYMGSKRRIAKHIAPIIQGFIESGNYKTYIEPFVGGANMIEHIVCENRYGSDVNRYLISLFDALQQGWTPPDDIDSEKYKAIMNNKSDYPAELVGCVGFLYSYGAKFFGGFIGSVKDVVCVGRDRVGESYRASLKIKNSIKGVQFTCHTYKNWAPENCVVYCDPPYDKTTKYQVGDFDHVAFWWWCKKYAEPRYNNTILVSEYTAPEGVECIWSKEINSSLTKDTGSKKGIEKLFLVK